MEQIIYYLAMSLYFVIPVGVLAFFIVSLCRFVSAKRKNKKQPDSISAGGIKQRRILLIISSAVLGVFVTVIVGLIALIAMAIAYM